ncbi:unnamed protein product [Clavelina lepadiformis]|uniref:HAT C-terminal dimerisation domain-containing protein n=1 Tax=Clavelina lepadiformis TaxID=159417 RepID=A0ABP0G1W4_CLALP
MNGLSMGMGFPREMSHGMGWDSWITFSKSVVSTVISFMKELNLSSELSDVCEVTGTVEQNPSDFDLLFVPPRNKTLKFGTPIMSNCIEEEVNTFQKLRQPSSQPLDYWKNEHRFPLLTAGAKTVLAIPVSSAAVERLFSAAGLLLTKLGWDGTDKNVPWTSLGYTVAHK